MIYRFSFALLVVICTLMYTAIENLISNFTLLLLQAIYLFGFGIPLFIDSNDQTHKMKWGLWVLHRLVLTAIYGLILFMYNSKWRERLPGKLTGVLFS